MDHSFIWDLDGTILDSYDLIVRNLMETYSRFGAETDEEELRRHVIRYSVSSYLEMMEKRTGLSFAEMKSFYSGINESRKLEIPLMKNAKEILEFLASKGCRNFVYTHRSGSAEPVLINLGVRQYFEDLVTGLDHFKRKPDPEGLEHLIVKYGLDRAKTFYVGDRSIDMECAANAGIGGILFLQEGSVTEPVGTEKMIVKDLMEISTMIGPEGE